MTADDRSRRPPQEPGPPPRDDLDELLRRWHRQSAERAAAGRDDLLRVLANQGGRPVSPQGERRFDNPEPTPPSTGRWATRPILPAMRLIRWLAAHRPARIAASILLVVGLAAVVLFPDWASRRKGVAMALDLREVGFAPPLLAAGGWPALDDEATLRTAEQAVADARSKLEAALAVGDRNAANPWRAWTKLFRNLRAMGRWDEALGEALDFLAYAKAEDQEPDRYSMHYTALFEVGNIYLSLGDYETARGYYEESLAVARDYTDWLHRTGRLPDRRPHAFAAELAVGLPPHLWMLSRLASVEGDRQTAWDYHNRAGAILLDFFRKDCAFRGLTTPAGASLYDLCVAVAADVVGEDRSFEPPAVHVREHLLNEAMLLRLDREPDAAATALAQAADLPYWVRADDFRQDFYFPMEALRIAIARGRFEEAVRAADEAARNTGPRDRPGFPYQEPIGVLARAELRFLRGTALAALDPTDPEALSLIDSAINTVHQSAKPLPEDQQTHLLRRFDEWGAVAQEIRADGTPEPGRREQPIGQVSLASPQSKPYAPFVYVPFATLQPSKKGTRNVHASFQERQLCHQCPCRASSVRPRRDDRSADGSRVSRSPRPGVDHPTGPLLACLCLWSADRHGRL
ncbi:MAG TPA: tetratricopeptide repeat protein [Phycisphaerae bacterium]|nr:tetratricopeptide repeat protein [Phycisphaerae bacterium]